jgi:HK97 family phage prohead protease
MIERRYSHATQLRASQGDEGSMVISGYAGTWNRLSENLGGFREMLIPGAFQRSLQSDRNVACLFNHSPDQILGTTRAGTLRVNEDAVGLKFRCEVANTSVGKDVYALVKRGDVGDCSFAFKIAGPDGEDWDDDCEDPDTGERIAVRKVSRADLFDVSCVQSPAYSGTSVNTISPTSMYSTPHRSMLDYFPGGVPPQFPAEIRSKILRDSSNRFNSRHRLMNLILGS